MFNSICQLGKNYVLSPFISGTKNVKQLPYQSAACAILCAFGCLYSSKVLIACAAVGFIAICCGKDPVLSLRFGIYRVAFVCARAFSAISSRISPESNSRKGINQENNENENRVEKTGKTDLKGTDEEREEISQDNGRSEFNNDFSFEEDLLQQEREKNLDLDSDSQRDIYWDEDVKVVNYVNPKSAFGCVQDLLDDDENGVQETNQTVLKGTHRSNKDILREDIISVVTDKDRVGGYFEISYPENMSTNEMKEVLDNLCGGDKPKLIGYEYSGSDGDKNSTAFSWFSSTYPVDEGDRVVIKDGTEALYVYRSDSVLE